MISAYGSATRSASSFRPEWCPPLDAIANLWLKTELPITSAAASPDYKQYSRSTTGPNDQPSAVGRAPATILADEPSLYRRAR